MAKSKMPFSSCHEFVDFVWAADPNSCVFSQMPGGRDTVIRKTQELHKSVLKPGLVNSLRNSHWFLVADESADSATMEQLGIYVQYIDLEFGRLCEDYWTLMQTTSLNL